MYVGGESERTPDEEKTDTNAIVGVHYILPLLIEADLRYYSDNHWKLILSSDLHLTKHISFDWEYDTNNEYELFLIYQLSNQLSISVNYDKEYGVGIGLQYSF